ncbi:MAG TPA: hypothetical protein VNU92_12365 [Edaphobacter sp.]|nr:hypothetical protein [Edaphobacter sp.]
MPLTLQTKPQLLRSIRIWLFIFIIGLTLSGLTAFPLDHETRWLASFLSNHPILPDTIIRWLTRVHTALQDTGERYPFLAYGTDWLAFAHLVLAIVFVGPLRDPVRNKWVLQFGVVACVSVIPLALIAGPIRGIPFLWRLIDCSFGIFGAVPLLICLHQIRSLETFE